MAEEAWTLVRMLQAVVAIVVIAAIVFLFFNKVYPMLRGEELEPEVKDKAEHNFDLFIANIKACRDINNTNCLCEGFPNWPGSFPLKSILTIKHIRQEVEINLSYSKKVLKSESIKGVKIDAMKTNKEKFHSVEKQINFKNEPPIFRQENIGGRFLPEWFVVSNYLYKNSDGIYFIMGKKEIAAEEQFPKCV